MDKPIPTADMRPGSTLVWSLLGWLTHLMVFAAMLFVFVKIVPTFGKMFQEFELDLPAPTVLVMHLGQFAVRFWWLAAFFSVFVNGAIWWLLPGRHRGLAWGWLLVPIALAMLLGLFTCVALFMPQASIVHSLSE